MSGAQSSPTPAETGTLLHASCVALTSSAGVLIMGPSGSGKSTLALSLMALGATLISDDQTYVRADADGLIATAPPAIKGQIEARGLGILAAHTLDQCRIRAVVDLSQNEEDRLPLPRKQSVVGVSIPLFYRVDGPQFAPSLIQWLKGGRVA